GGGPFAAMAPAARHGAAARRSLLHSDRDRQCLTAGAVARAAHGGGAERIEPDRNAHIRIARTGAARRIETDPAEIRHKGLRPRVCAVLFHRAVAAKVAGDVTGRDTQAAR